MASFQKRGKTWQYTISRIIDEKSKPIRKGGFTTKKEAQVAAREIENQLALGKKLFDDVPFKEYFRNWKELYKYPFVAKSTKTHLDATEKQIEAYFGKKSIQSITKDDYQEFIIHYGKTRSKETVQKLNSHIKSCVAHAFDDRVITVNFTNGSKVYYQVEAKDENEKFLDYDEAQKLIKECFNRLSLGVSYYAILLALYTGLRFEEIVGLTFSDFDFKDNTINVNKTYGYNNRMPKGFGPTKNQSSRRKIKVEEKMMRAFKSFVLQVRPNEHEIVFYSDTSKYGCISNGVCNKILKEMCGDLKISKITMHGLRHTHASILLYKKVSVYYVSERLGHENITTTLETYAHILKELRTEEEALAINVFRGII